jgi:hypothetical protein
MEPKRVKILGVAPQISVITEPMFCRTPIDLKDAVEQLAIEKNWSIAYAHAYVLRLGLAAMGVLDSASLIGD